jgi:hypothetical protein
VYFVQLPCPTIPEAGTHAQCTLIALRGQLSVVAVLTGETCRGRMGNRVFVEKKRDFEDRLSKVPQRNGFSIRHSFFVKLKGTTYRFSSTAVCSTYHLESCQKGWLACRDVITNHFDFEAAIWNGSLNGHIFICTPMYVITVNPLQAAIVCTGPDRWCQCSTI